MTLLFILSASAASLASAATCAEHICADHVDIDEFSVLQTSHGPAKLETSVSVGDPARKSDKVGLPAVKTSSAIDSQKASYEPLQPNAPFDGIGSVLISIIVAAILMGGLRLFERAQPSELLSSIIFVVDVLIWYYTTSLYLALTKQTIRAFKKTPTMILITAIQVVSGCVMLPLGEPRQLVSLKWQSMRILAFSGFAYFMGSYFVLATLIRTNIVFLSDIRVAEPILTIGLMAVCGGEKVNRWQAVCVMLVAAGLFVQALEFQRVSSLLGIFCPSVFFDTAIGMMGNFCYSCRNVVLFYAADLLPSISKPMIFGTTCLLALLPSLFLLFCYIPTEGLSETSELFSHPWLVLGSSSSFVLYNLASFLVLLRAKPVSHGMLMQGKRVASVLLACLFAHEVPTALESIGLCASIVGMAMFEKMKDSDEKVPTVAKIAAPPTGDEIQATQAVLTAPKASTSWEPRKLGEDATLIQKWLLSDFGFNVCFAILAVSSFGTAPFIINSSLIAQIQESQLSEFRFTG